MYFWQIHKLHPVTMRVIVWDRLKINEMKPFITQISRWKGEKKGRSKLLRLLSLTVCGSPDTQVSFHSVRPLSGLLKSDRCVSLCIPPPPACQSPQLCPLSDLVFLQTYSRLFILLDMEETLLDPSLAQDLLLSYSLAPVWCVSRTGPPITAKL